MLTSKQRASLRGMANTLDTILYIGKEGITDNTVRRPTTRWRRAS